MRRDREEVQSSPLWKLPETGWWANPSSPIQVSQIPSTQVTKSIDPTKQRQPLAIFVKGRPRLQKMWCPLSPPLSDSERTLMGGEAKEA
uniref:Uncharacterized protein n=1 Tax=Leersia perrieri TaxID=77586 RepID=A0A0D9WE98_9ORYZ